uniref:Putative nonstructural protein n=1 Tax=Ferak virus TaxID=1664810 RepID=A0A0H4BB68_9VIRU|nr:putative nonstructural protein [Ferak virus]
MSKLTISISITVLAFLVVNSAFLYSNLNQTVEVTENCVVFKTDTYCKISRFDICKINNYSCILTFLIILFTYISRCTLIVGGILFVFKLANLVVLIDNKYAVNNDSRIV